MKVALAVLLLAVATIAAIVPVLACPDCALPPTARPPVEIPLGCPRCGDAGKVSTANRWIRRGLDPRLTALLQATRAPVENLMHLSVPALEALGVRSEESIAVGFADARFLDDGEERLLAAYVGRFPRFTFPGVWTVVLFAPDGAILDRVELRCTAQVGKPSSGWGRRDPKIRYFRLSVAEVDPFTFQVVRDSVESRLAATELRVHARGGRLEIEAAP